MQQQPKLIGDVSHSLKFLLKRATSELCEQMISTGIISYLLKILGDQLQGKYYIVIFIEQNIFFLI